MKNQYRILNAFSVAGALFFLGNLHSSETDLVKWPQSKRWVMGDATHSILGIKSFNTPVKNLVLSPRVGALASHDQLFSSGNKIFAEPWVMAGGSVRSRDGLGPLLNANSCASCHVQDGRGKPPTLEEGNDVVTLLARLSLPGKDENGMDIPEPNYGFQLQDKSIPGVPPEGKFKVHWQN